MALDDVILQIGEFGGYQRRIFILVCIPVIFCASHMVGTSFFGLTVNTRCMLPNETAKNATYQMSTDLINTLYIVKNKSGLIEACEIRQNYSIEGYSSEFNSTENYQKSKTCERFIYDTSIFESTTATEWDLVCDRSWLKTLGDSLLLVGVMIGAIFSGTLSDKFGRRPTLLLFLFIQLIGGLLASVAPTFILYTIFRLIIGASSSGVFLVAFVIAVELVGPTKRGIAAVCYQFFWSAGYILVCGFAYIFPSWRKLQFAISVPSFAFIVYWWLIPESIRWMMTNGRVEQATDELERASKENGKKISRDTLDRLIKENLATELITSKETSILDLFRYPSLRKKIIILAINWFVISGTYYRLTWNVVTLGGNVYINQLISGLVEIPVTFIVICSLDRWGRKLILSSSLFIVGAALISSAFMPEEYLTSNIVIFMIGKAAVSLCFTIIYIFTVEQIPTAVRNIGLGTCCTWGKIGAITAPLFTNLSDIWLPLPLIAFGSMSLFCSAVTIILPETLGAKLPETVMEGEVYMKINQSTVKGDTSGISLKENISITPEKCC